MNPLVGYVVIAFGLFTVMAACCDWEFYMNHRKARIVIALMGRQGTRVFYGVIGSAMIVAGVLMAVGLFKDLR
jgi:hypothetical protein